MWQRIHLTLALAGVVALSGCGGSSGGEPPPAGGAEPFLRAVTSAADLEASIKSSLTTVDSDAMEAGAALDAGVGGASPAGFSGTYTQERNVDEFDAVRYDGTHLYVAPRRFQSCCFLLTTSPADGATNTGDPAQASIRILATDPSTGEATLASSIPLDTSISVQGMYTEGDRLVALTSDATYGQYGDAFTMPAIWLEESLGYLVYNTTDKSAPELVVDVTMDGVFIDSRRIGNTVYIVSRYAPSIDNLILDPSTPEEAAQNAATLANVTLDELLPKITIDGVTSDLVDPARCWVNNGDSAGYPVITSVTAVPIDEPTAFTSSCLADDLYGIYVSESAIYFPQIVRDAADAAISTRIHKFALASGSIGYRGTGEVEGRLWRGGQADFRMNEYQGDLRVMPTRFTDDSADFLDHKLYVLRESPTSQSLDIVGELPNPARPEPIGKPNEDLYGVRFLGERAYAVTFERIDPLYAFDLSDPTDPVVAGELEVTGFSDFLHPVSDALLLGLGRDETGALKLELFDVSSISAPLSRGSLSIGSAFAFSEALHERHAFTYLADVGGVDRFAIPVEDAGNSDGTGPYRASLALFEVRDKATPALSSLFDAGRIEPPVETAFPYASRHRAFINGDAVYYVRDEEIWSAMWQSPSVVSGPY